MSGGLRHGRSRILVIEAPGHRAGGYRAALESSGFAVLVVSEPAEALLLLRSRTAIHAVVADYAAVRTNPLGFVTEVRTALRAANTPVVLVGATVSFSVAVALIHAGCSRLLPAIAPDALGRWLPGLLNARPAPTARAGTAPAAD